MIELILIFFLSLFVSLFLFLYLKEKKNGRAIMANTIRLLIHQEQQFEAKKTDKEKSNEDFLKFVSDSRDLAYQYIESVQAGLQKFIDEVEPQIEYYDKYGAAVEGMVAPHDFALKKISSEFKELKRLLPEDNGKII